jgi:hypothetical protein
MDQRYTAARAAAYGKACVAFGFTLVHGKITAIDLLADPARLERVLST